MRIPLCHAGALVALLTACGGETAGRHPDAVDPSAMPESIRADYQVFADRCSKCHSLARPLAIGPQTDDYWATYVERMRRQAGSGISREDVVVVLRFLHYRSNEQHAALNAREGDSTTTEPAPAVPAAPATPEGRN